MNFYTNKKLKQDFAAGESEESNVMFDESCTKIITYKRIGLGSDIFGSYKHTAKYSIRNEYTPFSLYYLCKRIFCEGN